MLKSPVSNDGAFLLPAAWFSKVGLDISDGVTVAQEILDEAPGGSEVKPTCSY